MGKNYDLNTLLQTKKKHPCGSDTWKVVRMGMDIKIQCLGCGRIVMLTRDKFEKRIKKIVKEQ